MIWQSLIGPVTGLIGDHFKRRAEEKKATHERKLQVIQNDAAWENKMADSSLHSWKDEFWTVILAAPIFFVAYAIWSDDPGIIRRVVQGFDALADLPDWYQYLLFLSVSASFGIRGADKLMGLRKKG